VKKLPLHAPWVRDLYPGAIETWIMLVLEQRQQEYADEREVLRHTTVWADSGHLVLGWQVEGRQQPHLTRWDSKKLTWADGPADIEFVQSL